MARRPLVANLVVCTLAVVACGEIPEPEGFSVGSSTVAESSSNTEQAEAEPVTTTPSLAPTSTEFVPRPAAGYEPQVLISTPQQVLVATTEGTQPLQGAFAGLGSVHAVDDLLGGLVLQQADASGEISWLRAEGEEAETVDNEGSELLDVGYAGGSPFAVVLVGDTRVDGIRLVDHERTPVVTIEDDEEVIDLSVSAGLFAVAIENERCGDLRFYGLDGEEVLVRGPGEPDCIVPHRPVYGAVALSPDGGTVVYTVVSYRDDAIEVATELVARDLSTGEVFFQRKIGEDGDSITALSFDGQRAVFLRQSVDQTSVTVLPLIADAPETPIDVAGATVVNSVAFTRLSVANGV